MARAHGYGQFCPVAKAAEILAERWTPIVLRELLYGTTRFQEFRRGIPRITPAMLSSRLEQLIDAGLVVRHGRGRGGEYRLTAAGQETRPIIEQLGRWGQRWVDHAIADDDLDPAFVMWAVHRHLRLDALPAPHVVALFQFPERPPSERRWWLLIDGGEVDLCLSNPGHAVDLTITTDVRTLTQMYLGRVDPTAAMRSGQLHLEGARPLVRTFSSWCARSKFAEPARTVRAPAAGKQRRSGAAKR